MTGLEPGDVLAVQSGRYSGGIFSNLNGITIINNGGLVTFAGKVELSGNTDITISGKGDSKITYGFYFTDGGFAITKRSVGLRIYNCQARDVHRFVDASENQTTLIYTGDTSSILLQRVAIANIKLNNCGTLLCGSFGMPHDLHNVIDSVAIFNATYDSTNEEGMVVFGANIYRFDFHDIRIHEIPVYNNHDIGMFSVYGGNGQVHNIYRKGGWGWLCRMYGGSLGDIVRDIWIYNNIDLASTCYGTADIRVEAAQWGNSKFFKGVNIHIINNTSGDKKDNLNYTTAVALIPNLEPGYSCEIKNNLSFNNQNPGRSGTGFEYWNISNPPDTGGNLYFSSASAAGLKDSINCYLLPESAAVDQGLTIGHIRSDIEGLPRPQGNAFDVGARESSFTAVAFSGFSSLLSWENKKKYLTLGAILIIILAGIFVLRKMRTENSNKTGHRYSSRHNVKR
ncbi:MAG: hypothetical protein JST75_03075 [Bacteroidetes bacterium]|nr:hypothetical protein [Bacteroidota bacterium]